MTDQNFSLKDKCAVVTGATGLLGKEHCHALAASGANIVVCDININEINDFTEMLPTESFSFKLDVTDVYNIIQLREFILNKFGKIDVLVNNAAINDMFENINCKNELSMFENYPLDLWNKSINVNITGVFLCSQILGREMAIRNNGSIINIASTYGIVAPDQRLYKRPDGEQYFYKTPVYSVTKGAVLAFTKYLASYWGSCGVRVNAISPGGVENNQDEYFIKQYSDRTPLGRMAKPSDYRGALIYLASDASSYMTGANLVVDGGWTIW